MNNNSLQTLFTDLMDLCSKTDSFYYLDQQDNNGNLYRVFSYRLPSYKEFQYPNATECRGHTFRKIDDKWVLASLPPQKFFNYGEHVAWGHNIDLNSISLVMDKMDGSLISTVKSSDSWFLKSKTSFKSQQADSATKWLNSRAELWDSVDTATKLGYTVNFEWVSPSNQIVIAYPEDKLIVLNARHLHTGDYMPYSDLVSLFGKENVVGVHDIPKDAESFMRDCTKIKGIEGFIICFKNGLWVKHKTESYCIIHNFKDCINSDKRLWEACVNEESDDLRAFLHGYPTSISKIIDMEEKVSAVYNKIHKTVWSFYEQNKHLDRKSYAILCKQVLGPSNLFPLAMNLYIGKPLDIKGFMFKNYESYGIKDEVLVYE